MEPRRTLRCSPNAFHLENRRHEKVSRYRPHRCWLFEPYRMHLIATHRDRGGGWWRSWCRCGRCACGHPWGGGRRCRWCRCRRGSRRSGLTPPKAQSQMGSGSPGPFLFISGSSTTPSLEGRPLAATYFVLSGNLSAPSEFLIVWRMRQCHSALTWAHSTLGCGSRLRELPYGTTAGRGASPSKTTLKGFP
jgi:hypothetical protein